MRARSERGAVEKSENEGRRAPPWHNDVGGRQKLGHQERVRKGGKRCKTLEAQDRREWAAKSPRERAGSYRTGE